MMIYSEYIIYQGLGTFNIMCEEPKPKKPWTNKFGLKSKFGSQNLPLSFCCLIKNSSLFLYMVVPFTKPQLLEM